MISARALLLLTCSAIVCSACAARPQDTFGPAATPGALSASFPAPSRRVADIVAPRWTTEDSRDNAGEFARVAALAGVHQGARVADIGAGDGYYVMRLAPLVGESGRVYGEDIMVDYLRLLQQRVLRGHVDNVHVVLGDLHDPRLPTASIEIAFMIHMYHEIGQPFGVLWNLATAMQPRGRLVILDLERPTFNHGTPPSLLRCELAAVGYRELSFTKTGVEEYVAIFEAPSAATRPSASSIRTQLAAQPCVAP